MENDIKETRVEAMLKAKQEKLLVKGLGTKLQISARINVTAVAVLDMIADAVGETRTSLAADLLTAAIWDASKQFGFAATNTPEFYEQIRGRLNDLHPEAEEGNYAVTDARPIVSGEK